jgi:hypothetical protein
MILPQVFINISSKIINPKRIMKNDRSPFPARGHGSISSKANLTLYYVLVVSGGFILYRKAHMQIFIMNLVEESSSLIPRSRLSPYVSLFVVHWFELLRFMH